MLLPNLIFFGPPGGGKGTEIQLLQKKGFIKLSTGDMLRKEVESESSLGKKLKSIMDKGELVSDTLVSKLIEKQLSKKSGIIFDGYPRTIKQAKSLTKLLKSKNIDINGVIIINTPDDLIIKRISGRYICKKCGASYNKFGNQPKKEGICDVCGGKTFIQRSDDKKSVIKKRLNDYHQTSKEIIEYYRKKGLVYDIDASKGESKITHKMVLKVIKNL
jgi:adenylate kinase